MKTKLLIIGASGHGKVVADIAMKMNKWEYIAFLDDNKNIETLIGLEIIGTLKDVFIHLDDFEIFVGIGDNETRQKIYEMLEAHRAHIPVLIHPNANVGSQVNIGNGTVIMAGVVVNCHTNIGKGCIINTGATIDHDNFIEDYVHISPGVHLGGTVKIGKASWLGIGSLVRNNINITNGCKLGVGSVVIKDISEPGVYIGAPTKKMNC